VGHENADAQNDECTCQSRSHTPPPSLNPVKGVNGCTVKTIHDHERCCRVADEFEPQRLDCNIRNGPPSRTVPARGLERCTSWDRFCEHARGKRCPLCLMCVRATLAPRYSRFTISQIGEMIGTPFSHETAPLLLEATPPIGLPGLPAGKFALLERHKTC
jgi:hypothetical protein